MISKSRASAKALAGRFFALAVAVWPSVAWPDSGATLYRFKGAPDGAFPSAPLIDGSGAFYSTTNGGGISCSHIPTGCGTIFNIAPDGKERVVHRFAGGCDGAAPSFAGLVPDGDGNFYGTTSGGGACDSAGFGTVFELTAKGKESVLYAFTGGSDGSGPLNGVSRDGDGNLFGVTAWGGATAAAVQAAARSSRSHQTAQKMFCTRLRVAMTAFNQWVAW